MNIKNSIVKSLGATILFGAASLTQAATIEWGELQKWTDADQGGVFSLGDAGSVSFSLKSDPLFKTTDIPTDDKSVMFEQHTKYDHITGDAVKFGGDKQSHEMVVTFDLSQYKGEGDEIVLSIDTSVGQKFSTDGVDFTLLSQVFNDLKDRTNYLLGDILTKDGQFTISWGSALAPGFEAFSVGSLSSKAIPVSTPTSAALMILGIAGLVLKRRSRKI